VRGEAGQTQHGGAAERTVLHVLDYWRNLDTPYFRSILGRHSPTYDVAFCLLSERPHGSWGAGPFGDRIVTLGSRSPWHHPWAAVRLAAWLRRHRIGLVHAHFFYPTLVALTAAKLASVPMVYTRHHSDHNIRLNKPLHVRVDGWCGRLADRAIAVSEATKRLMVDVEGVAARQISVVLNGMDPPPSPTTDEMNGVRAELIPEGTRVCLMIARLHEEKGHRVLFEAIPFVVGRIGPVLCLLAGEGPHRETLEAEARALGVAECVRFLGQRRDVPALIAVADVVVLPSLAESFGYALVEAMSLGRPVVASDSGGIPEVVADEETGLIAAKGDAEALARALVRVLADRALADRLGNAGRRRAALFSFDRMIKGYEDVYRQVLGSADRTDG
jgi:glycosyltransferase involved in cell wall biosynthesis